MMKKALVVAVFMLFLIFAGCALYREPTQEENRLVIAGPDDSGGSAAGEAESASPTSEDGQGQYQNSEQPPDKKAASEAQSQDALTDPEMNSSSDQDPALKDGSGEKKPSDSSTTGPDGNDTAADDGFVPESITSESWIEPE